MKTLSKKRTVVATLCVGIGLAVGAIMSHQSALDADILPKQTIPIDGGQRSYRLVVPHRLPDSAPVVFAFPGVGDSAEFMAKYSELDRLAVENGFLLVYLEAERLFWKTIDVDTDQLDDHPDVRFFDELLDQLSESYGIDQNRIYLMGISNGGAMAQIVLHCRSDRIAAVVALCSDGSGYLGPTDNPRPILLVVGENDMRCDKVRADADRYREAGHDVELIIVPGLGHAWPKGFNQSMWEFLSRQTLK